MSELRLSDLTLIMVTYRRQAYALRGMAYWSKLGVVLHVIDGSPEPIAAALLTNMGGNVHYHHYPVGVIARYAAAIPLVDTPYASFISDDEFYLKSGIVASMNALQADPELVACGGQCMKFWPGEDGTILADEAHPLHKGWARDEERPAERVELHFERFAHTIFYAIVRADVFLGGLRLFTAHEYNAFALGELQYELYALWCGKARRLDNLFWVRSRENTPIRGTDPSTREVYRVHDWWRDPLMRKETESFVALTAAHLTAHAGSQREAADVVRRAISAHADFLERYFAPKPYTIKRICRGVLRRLKRWLGIQTQAQPVGTPLPELLATYEPEVVAAAQDDVRELNELLSAWHSPPG